MTSCWMASLGFVYGLLLGNCEYQTDRKIYDQSEIAVCLRSTSTTSTPTPRFEPGPQCQLTMYQQAEIEYAEFLTSSLLASTSFKQKAYYTLLKVIHRDVVGKRCCFLVPNWAMWAEKLDRGKTGNKSNKEVCSSTRGLQSTWVHIKQTTLHWRFLVKKTVRFHIDLPTSRAKIFSPARSASGRFFVFLRQKWARERKLVPTTGTGNVKRRTLRKSRFHIA